MADVTYSDDALNDLDKIYDYIAMDLQSPGAALNTVNKIQDSIDKLSTFPLMGTPLTSVIDINTDYRFLVCGKYLAFYRTAGEEVLIIHIIYGRRDYVKILFPDLIQEENDNGET